jgi:hypothetical protein
MDAGQMDGPVDDEVVFERGSRRLKKFDNREMVDYVKGLSDGKPARRVKIRRAAFFLKARFFKYR